MDAVNRKYIPDGLNTIDRTSRFEHRFLVLRKLGQGTYGKVQLALNKETNEEVAVKTIKKAKIENDEDMLRIRREIHIMTSLRHPHIVHIHEVFESRQKIVIVMQYASGGELYDYLGCHQILPEDEARRIFRQIASAIYYCHKNQICHRDLKLENILLDEEGNAKIADFGLSNVFDDHHTMNTFCGSPLYASPEIVKGTPYKGPEVDCWSMGVLLYTLVYGTMPFDGRSFKELVTQISEGRYEEPVHKSNASSLIRWLLTPDISKRATIKDVCNDKWVNKGYDTSLLEVAENMALLTRLHREKILSTKRSLETTTKNEKEKSIFKKAAEHLEEKAGKFTSLFTKNFEVNGKRNNAGPETQKPSFYEQITNYDVQFVLNKLITAVESSIKAEKNLQNLKNSESSMASTCNALNKEEHPTEKTDSAYIIPIFEVTSTIPKDMNKNLFIIGKNTGNISNNFKIPRQERIQKENSGIAVHLKEKLDNAKKCLDTTKDRSRNLSKTDMVHNNKTSSNPNQKNSLNASNQPVSNKANYQTGTHDQAFSHHSFRRSKRINDSIPVGQKPPGSFLRTKNHVLSLARLLSLNYEKIIRNSFRMPACKKKLPGKITIPPTFDPNNPPTSKKQVEEKKELLIFPTVSVSENKEKIQKKIEKIKNAALNKNIIIRSDSKTRMRIEQYIRSQVKKIQDLVLEEQRSLQASLEHLDEQSLRDMSELYYRAFGSENTDSGIANTEEEDYFCFICSKPNNEKAMNGMVSSINLENIRRGSLYTSNHLHIPKGKELNKWGYVSRNFNTELGSLNRCKSEIHFPIEYLDYISTNKSDLSKRTNPQQQIQKNQIGNTQFFSAVSSVKQQNNANYRLLRSASDSIGLDFSKNAFDVIELNSDSTNFQNYKINPHFLEQITSNECKFYETTDYDIQSCATDATFMNRSQILENDDGIGDSNDSFQSYIENLDSNTEHVITRSMSEHSCMNFSKANSNNASLFTKLSSDLHSKSKHESELGNYQRLKNRTDTTDTFDSESWLSTIENENDNIENKGKNKGLRRRNTMSCLRRDSETEIVDPNSSEFESYLWNAYKEHLLENQTNSDCSSSPNVNYYSLDRKTNFKHSDTERIDDINGFSTYDYMSKLFPNSSTLEQIRGDDNSPVLKNILKHSKVSHQRNSGSRLNRTKSVCPELLSGSDRDDQIRRLKEEQRFWGENTIFDQNEGKNHSITSNILNDIKKDRGRKTPKCLNRRRYPSNTLSPGKSPEYKKSFLQLLALKRIQEAEKELDKSNSSNLAPLEENPGSLLEALKTHGYKSVISQRFQDTNDDEYLDSFYTRYLKSPRNLRAELARLNHMYYQSLPRYMLGTYDENIFFDDTDYNGSFLNDLGTASYYESETPTYSDMLPDFKHQSRQCVYDWLDSTQVDEYLNSLRPDSLNIPDEIPFQTTSDTRKCCTQWGRENFRSLDEESTSDSQSTIEETPSNSKYSTYQKNKEQNIPIETNFRNTERFQPSSLDMNDEREESVQDRIWRKSFYPRFNNRHLSRKGRSSLVELELPENRLGLLNNLYNSNLKTGYDKPLYTQGNRSNTSFHSIRSKKHSQSQNKFDSRSSMKKLYAKPSKEHLIQHDNQESTSDNARELYNTNENEEPEH